MTLSCFFERFFYGGVILDAFLLSHDSLYHKIV